MNFLINKGTKTIMFIADSIHFGEYEGEKKWALFDADDRIFLYVMDFGDFLKVNYSGPIPDDFTKCPNKYLFIDGEIVQNPDWKEPEPPAETRIAELEAALNDLIENVLPELLG